MRFKIPKNLLKLRFSHRFFLWLFGSTAVSLMFIILSILKGASVYSQKNIIRNYNSYISVKPLSYNSKNLKDLSTWWQSTDASVEQLTNQDFIRSVTSRTILPALYTNNEACQAIHLIAVNPSDTYVFSNIMARNSGGIFIPLDFVNIGSKLAQKFDLKENDLFPIIIPSLNILLTNIRISYIFEADDPFYDNYGVYISQNMLTNFIENRFTDYYIRFSATPFYPLFLSNINAAVENRTRFIADDLLAYQYKMISLLENRIIIWTYLLYIILGFLLFFVHYFHRYRFLTEYKDFAYRMGVLFPPSLNMKILFSIFPTFLQISLTALALLGVFIYLDPSIPSSWFFSSSGIYQDFALPLAYQFKPILSVLTLLKALLGGMIFFFLGYMFVQFCYFIISILKNNDENSFSYIVLAMIAFCILGYFSSDHYFYYTSVNKGVEKQWKDNYFGAYNLTDKGYSQDKFIGIPVNSFELDPLLEKQLIDKKIPYLISLESLGQASSFGETNSVKKKDVFVKSISGNYLPLFEEVIAKISSNQVIVGKNIGDYFLTNKIFTLDVETRDGQKKTLSLPISEVIEFPLQELNDTVFLNQKIFSEMLEISQNRITKIQSSRKPDILKNYTNQQIVFHQAKDQYQFWQVLTHLVLISFLISSVLYSIAGFIFLSLIIFYFAVGNRDDLVYYKIWGMKFQPYKKYYLVSIACFFLGSVCSFCGKLSYIALKTKLPEFFMRTQISLEKINFSIDFIALFLLLFIILILGLFFYYILFNKVLKKISAEVSEYIYRNKLS